jgi:hypothetical protein
MGPPHRAAFVFVIAESVDKSKASIPSGWNAVEAVHLHLSPQVQVYACAALQLLGILCSRTLQQP